LDRISRLDGRIRDASVLAAGGSPPGIGRKERSRVTTLKRRRAVATSMGDAAGRPCPMCDRPMTHRHCKYVCPEHGVVYDCSYTFY